MTKENMTDMIKAIKITKRIEGTVKNIAKDEPVRVELFNPGNIRDGFYIFTTELGMYRIWDKYSRGGKCQEVASKGFSPGQNSFYVFVRALS